MSAVDELLVEVLDVCFAREPPDAATLDALLARLELELARTSISIARRPLLEHPTTGHWRPR